MLYYNGFSASDGRNLDHAGHRVGNDIDIRYPGVDGGAGERLWTESEKKVGGKKEFERVMEMIFTSANDWGMHANYVYNHILFSNVKNADAIHKNHFHLGYR